MVDVASLGIKNEFVAHSIRQFSFGDNILFVELNFCPKPEGCRGSNQMYVYATLYSHIEKYGIISFQLDDLSRERMETSTEGVDHGA